MLALLALAALAPLGLAARAQSARVWEVNGVRLEASQVERLASDIARQTVAAVERQPGLDLRPEQSSALESIYHRVALDTYDRSRFDRLSPALIEMQLRPVLPAGAFPSVEELREMKGAHH